MTFNVKTNNVPRPILSFWDLPQKLQKKAAEDIAGVFLVEEHEVASDYIGPCFVYKGEVYSLRDFLRVTCHGGPGFTFHLPPDHPMVLAGWSGINQDGLGMVVKSSDDGESLVVGWATGI